MRAATSDSSWSRRRPGRQAPPGQIRCVTLNVGDQQKHRGGSDRQSDMWRWRDRKSATACWQRLCAWRAGHHMFRSWGKATAERRDGVRNRAGPFGHGNAYRLAREPRAQDCTTGLSSCYCDESVNRTCRRIGCNGRAFIGNSPLKRSMSLWATVTGTEKDISFHRPLSTAAS